MMKAEAVDLQEGYDDSDNYVFKSNDENVHHHHHESPTSSSTERIDKRNHHHHHHRRVLPYNLVIGKGRIFTRPKKIITPTSTTLSYTLVIAKDRIFTRPKNVVTASAAAADTTSMGTADFTEHPRTSEFVLRNSNSSLPIKKRYQFA